MFLPIVIWLIVSASILSLVYILYCAWAEARAKAHRLDLSDVAHFLYPVDCSLLEWLLDPAADFELRWGMGPRAVRAEQRRRMVLYRELVQRMFHNAGVLARFDDILPGNRDFSAGPSQLRQTVIKVRLYSGFARLRLRIWLLLPNGFGAGPDLARLRRVGDVDGPKAYRDLKAAAAHAFARLRPTELDAVTRNL